MLPNVIVSNRLIDLLKVERVNPLIGPVLLNHIFLLLVHGEINLNDPLVPSRVIEVRH
jgi:hypothetical protein